MEARDVEKTYLYVNKRCGSVAGVWPYGNRRKMWIGRTTMIIIAATSLASQIAKVKMNLSTDAVIEQCPYIAIAIGILLKELNYVIHEEKLKEILECLFNDWLTKRPKDEMDILHKYARRGLFFNRLYVGRGSYLFRMRRQLRLYTHERLSWSLTNGIFCYIIFTAVAVTPRILDIVSPINGSRGVGFIYPAYYGLDEEEYYYILMGHMLSVITVVFFVYISSDSIYMNIVQHACGLLSISGYRFKWAIREMNGNDKKHSMMLEEAYRSVCHSIRAHQDAVKSVRSFKNCLDLVLIQFFIVLYIRLFDISANSYIVKIESLHATYLFILVGLIMLSLSVTLVKTSMMEPCVEFYKYCGFLIVQLIHLLFLSIQGHFVVVSHDRTYNKIYDGMWYIASPRTQALYTLALRKNLSPPMLTAGGLISLNLETFAEILKGSVSWVTVMKSA